MTGSDDPVVDIAVRHLSYLAGEVPDPPALTDLDPVADQQARILISAVNAAWGADELEPPPLEQHPLAISLGLVPDPTRPLSSTALRSARQRARLAVSELAARLTARGWDVPTRDVARWERQPAAAATVAPAVIKAIAAELDTDVDRLLGEPAALPTAIAEVIAADRFRDLARRWARAIGLGADERRGAGALQQLMLAGSVRRGAELDAEEWLAALDALVGARERHPGTEQEDTRR